MDWVTGPALQILIQQRGMRVGDHVQIQLCPCADGKHGAPGDEKFVGEDLEVALLDYGELDRLYPVHFEDERGERWCVGWCQVVAWRPRE